MPERLLGIDIGGTKVALALADGEGGVRARKRRPTEPSGDPAKDVRRLAHEVRALVTENGDRLEDVISIGVSVPGPLDRERGVVFNPPNLPAWRNVPIRQWLADELGRPVRIENDANAAALAEWHFGAGRGFEHLVYLTMSTGVGGGLILDGRLYAGRGDLAGEIGHVPIVWEGEPCVCGLRGCLEAYVGGAAWTERLRELAPADSRAVALAGERRALKPEHVVEAAREGDAFALAEIARMNDYLARAIVMLGFTLSPQAVILGTIVVAAGEDLCLAPVRAAVRAHAWPHVAGGLEILPAELGDDLPYRAGLSVALEEGR